MNRLKKEVADLKKDSETNNSLQEIVSRHALAGTVRLESKAALMSRLGLCAKKTLHSTTCHLSSCMPNSKHVLFIRAVRVGPKSRFASLLASLVG